MSGLIEHYIITEGWRREPYNTKWIKNDPCPYCGNPSDTWDHLVSHMVREQQYPKHTILVGNRIRACSRCNREKSASTPLFFLLGRACKETRHTLGYYNYRRDDLIL
jgi:5-methylcytosine-specific restriction endonuclease McrA